VEEVHPKPFIIQGGLSMDDRGFVSFINEFDFSDVRRFYMVENHKQGFVRAWHGHQHEAKYILVTQGSAMVAAIELEAMANDKGTLPSVFYLSSKNPQILYIPPGHFNGFKTLDANTKMMFFSTSSLEESAEDDIRVPWNRWNIWETNYR